MVETTFEMFVACGCFCLSGNLPALSLPPFLICTYRAVHDAKSAASLLFNQTADWTEES